MSIFPRPLKRVLGKIIPFSKEDKVPTFNLGSGTADNTTFLRGDGTWATPAGGSGSIPHGNASGVDTYTTTISGVTSYNDGDAFLVRFLTGNTTGCTLNINGLGARTLYRNNDGVLIGGDIVNGAEMLCVYNSTTSGFQTIGTAPNTLISYVTNADSVTITKGQAVYAFGGQGDRLTVKLANNSSDATSAQTVGLVISTSIGVNQKGLIMVNGLLDGLSILPTATWSDGDAVYLGATAGSITKVKPVAPNHLVYLGFVTTASNGAAGRMYVRVQNGYELQELHNVYINPATLANNDIIQYDSSALLWKNESLSTAGIVSSVTGTSPISSSGGSTPAISISDAAADGSTKGASAFTASDFNSSSGVISIDYTNGQSASGSTKGFLTSTDWTVFNGKQNALTLTTTGTSGAATLVGSTLNIPQYSGGGSSNFSVISISATNSTAVTGTTANAIVSSILVPANTFGSNGIIDIAARYLKTGTASIQNVRMYVNTSSSLTGATLVANFYNGPNTQVGAWRTANISSNTINFLSTLGTFSSDLASIAGTGTSAPFNTSVNNFIIFAVQLGNGLDSCVLQFHKILRYA